MQSTTNYSIPTYETTDRPNLITGYNAGMAIIDTQLKNNADAIADVKGLTPNANDDYLDVNALADAKVDANGIVYIPQTTPQV